MSNLMLEPGVVDVVDPSRSVWGRNMSVITPYRV
ncbi:hypothetical protein M7I_5590 [Glarea lozoyensis 74030]|uniref:Uncharacterized protein n=1 Tax=Glarea lozoyensis (strain ATCC 74030 / MF5533) TaxID=1104152 RepID=H0ESB2_GLAL7|nr:hypothetical protein M7I_5590 [Glarea lozoyensis 74030]